MGEMTDKIVDLEEDARITDLRRQVNELRTANTQLRKQVRVKGIPVNVRDELFAQIDENQERIDELIRSMKKPAIVPITETTTVAEHNYEADTMFRTTSVRI